jgi:UPF0755 protein
VNWFAILSSAFATAIAGLLAAALLFIVETGRPGPSQEDATVVVPRGASVTSIARMLEAEGQVRSAIVFRAASQVYGAGKPMQAGEYLIPARASLRDVVSMIADGEAVQHPITLAEGLTSAMIVDVLARADVLTGAPPPVPPEGSILPETFNVQRGMDRTLLLAQMLDAQRELLEELWPQRAQNLPFDTPEEAITLASIVEKETGVAEERPQVAAVYINRLRRGMRLESDPTIIYGISKGVPLTNAAGQRRGLRRSELDDASNRYNTYQHDGLPPGPIANPGRASIEAVLNPPSTRDIFFVADGTGGHAFAATLGEHNRNVARWRVIEAQRIAEQRR